MERSTTSTEPHRKDGAADQPVRRGPRSLRDLDVRVFSSAGDAPRARRAGDPALGGPALVTIGGMTLAASGPGHLDDATQQFVRSLPGLFGWFWEIAYDLL